MSIRTTLSCLNGFLGTAGDWDSLFGTDCVKYDLFSPSSKVDSAFDLLKLGDWLNTDASVQPSPRVLLGYSLGGRIALHSLLQSPKTWTAAIIVSAHIGFRSDQDSERQARVKADENWAQKFEAGPWNDVLGEWDAQTVFGPPRILGHFGSDRVQRMRSPRFEKDFSRKRLANSLRTCSLGHQMDLRPALRHLQVPILWISGEQDAKYRAIAQEAEELNPRFKSLVIPGGGHRIPWERPKEFTQSVVDYLGQLNIC